MADSSNAIRTSHLKILNVISVCRLREKGVDGGVD
jgi:hypothetical protein